MSQPSNILEVHYGSTVHRYPVASASFLAVRYSGGFGLVIVVTGAKTKADPDPELPAISPTFSMILPTKELSLEVGTQWPFHFKNLSNTGIGVPPTFGDWDRHLVNIATVTIIDRTEEQFHFQFSGTIMERGDLLIDAIFEFRGVLDHDETGSYPVSTEFAGHVKSRGNWQKYILDEQVLQSGTGPVTEYEWQHTDRFRRLVGQLFELRPQAPQAPVASGIGGRLRRLFRRTPAPSPTSIPVRELLTPTLRQTKLLLASVLDHLLPDELCWVWNISGREMARMLERFADNEPTASDLNAVVRYSPNMCIIPPHAINLSPEDVAGNRANSFFGFAAMISPGMMGDLFIWRLVPERSRVGCDLLKCLFGNPFHSVAWQPEWRTSAVMGLAEATNELRDFSRMPILADALQEAGCEQDAILSHCRDATIHTRGCWVLDTILQRNLTPLTK